MHRVVRIPRGPQESHPLVDVPCLAPSFYGSRTWERDGTVRSMIPLCYIQPHLSRTGRKDLSRWPQRRNQIALLRTANGGTRQRGGEASRS